MTLYSVRTRRAFWSMAPAKSLALATETSVLISSCIALFGLLIAPIGLHGVVISWLYALVWFLVIDRVKLAVYALLNREKAGLGKTYQHLWQQLELKA